MSAGPTSGQCYSDGWNAYIDGEKFDDGNHYDWLLGYAECQRLNRGRDTRWRYNGSQATHYDLRRGPE